VKVRGYRIETGEIEAALREQEAVRDAVVVAREDESGGKRLIAYVVCHPGQSETTNSLREALLEKLPDYMAPSVFVTLEELPLTPNGKVDRRALPAPERARETLGNDYVAPRTQAEEALAGIWSRVLGVERVGIHDNFFALGGDSIRSLRIVALAREAGLEFSLQQLFRHQTIDLLSQQLSEAKEVATAAEHKPFSLISDDDRERLPEGIEDAYPLTLMQAGMLFESELNQESGLYHNFSSLHIRAPFDKQAFETALARLLSRHPVLRTSFDLTSYSQPLQLAHQQVAAPLVVEDARQLSEAEQRKRIAQWQADERQRVIDWREAPLARFHICRRTEETFQFSHAEHHAILDGWSLASMLTELFSEYLALMHGESATIPSLSSNAFRDFVALEQTALASEEDKQYWRQKLHGSDLTAIPRWPAAGGEPGGTRMVEAPIPPELSAGLKRMAQAATVPLKSVLLAAHLKALSLLSGQADVLTSVVSHGRPETADAERSLGLFLNTLPFRLTLEGETWMELVRKTFASEREMLPHRHYPLARMKADQGGRIMFETNFSYTHFHVYQSFDRPDEIDVIEESSFGETGFTLSADFSLDSTTSRLRLCLTGKENELCHEQMIAIGGYYAAALEAMATDPEARHDRTRLLSAGEQEQLLTAWNDTRAGLARDCMLTELFEKQADRAPEKTAVIFGRESLTYGELNAHANRLARHLKSLGVGPEVPVGICVERSLEMIVALLGVLKSGGAYVPLDPAYPAERLAFILDDVQAPVLLTQEHLQASLPNRNVQVVCLDRDEALITRHDDSNLENEARFDNLAYVIYTSGSTGVPKGVMIEHQSLAAYTQAATRMYGIGAGDRVLQFSSINFDASVEEIYPCLTMGGTLALRGAGMPEDAPALLRLCGEQEITVMSLPTAYWHVLTAEMSAGDWQSAGALRLMILGGESVLPERVRSFVESAGDRVRLMNTYGPTEATVVATAGELGREENRSLAQVGIGRPIDNTQVYVLDAQLEPAPIGSPGELYIGGNGLARGYLARPELTAGFFVPNPFSQCAGARLYRTGDRVRHLPNGNIEYLGRSDHQLKIRGYRIEMGEIEIALNEHEQVREAAVSVWEDAPGERRLVAYVAGKVGRTATANELRRYLRGRLPEYMVPSAFVMLEALPLMPNGKLDRRALPAPEKQSSDSSENYVAPRTPAEEKLAGIWASALGLERVGIHDNFFDLGGHSLLAIRLISRIRESFQVEIFLPSLFDRPTVAELAEQIETVQWVAERVKVRAASTAGDFAAGDFEEGEL
jgi:amino acid adenylation domain-containing protein